MPNATYTNFGRREVGIRHSTRVDLWPSMATSVATVQSNPFGQGPDENIERVVFGPQTRHRYADLSASGKSNIEKSLEREKRGHTHAYIVRGWRIFCDAQRQIWVPESCTISCCFPTFNEIKKSKATSKRNTARVGFWSGHPLTAKG